MSKNHLRVQSDATGKGTHVWLPDGSELALKAIRIEIEARAAEEVEVTFYLTKKLHVRLDGTSAGSGLFLENGEQIAGLIYLSVEPYSNSSESTATIRFYPLGSLFAQDYGERAAAE